MASLLGAGVCSAGTAFAGFGSPSTGTSPSTSVLHTSSNTQGECRKLDPNTGDYIFNADGSIQGCSAVEQLVLMALLNAKGSTAVPGVGLEMNTKTIAASYEYEIKTAVETAVAPLVAQNLIALTEVTIRRDAPSRLVALIRYTDLTSNVERTISV